MGDGHGPSAGTAQRFVDARLQGIALPAYPGAMPTSLDEAYAIQDAAIDLWPDDIAGWKIGLIQPPYRAQYGADRIAGPIFRANTAVVDGENTIDLPVIGDGFAAIEAEFILRLGHDAPEDRTDWSIEDAGALVDAVHVGIESAGSPFREINDHGPAVTASDFGNNAGLIVGPVLKDWDAQALSRFTAETRINGVSVGRGDASTVPGGPLAALAFVLGATAVRGRPLRKGQWISTGAVTGVHQIRLGESAYAQFGETIRLHCRAVPAEPRKTGRNAIRQSIR